jgi:hypothetical protein
MTRRFRLPRRRHLIAGLLAIILAGGVVIGFLGHSRPAIAGFGGSWPNPDCSYTSDGRCGNVGYFSGLQPFPQQSNNIAGVLPNVYNYTDEQNASYSGSWSFPGPGSPYYSTNGMTPGVAANNFIAFINFLLTGPNPLGCTLTNPSPAADFAVDGGTNPNAGCWRWRREKLGAAFLVLTMMGGKYTDYPGSAGPPADGPGFVFGNNVQTGFNAAVAAFPQWAQDVRQEDADGLVNWDMQRTFTAGTPDSTSIDFGHDVAQFENTIGQTNMTMDFHSAGGKEYIINRSCGNTWFRFTPPFPTLPVGFNMNLSATPVTAQVVPGQTGTISVSIKNTSGNGSASNPGRLQVQLPGANVTAPCGVSCSDANQQPLTFGDTGNGFSNTSGIGGVSGSNWFWNTTSFPDGTFSSAQLTFSVPAGAPPGGSITFDVYYNPGDQSGSTLHTTVTIAISSLRYPSVIGQGSDIHAGGGICSQPQSPGNIDTNVNAGSLGGYVVSASGTIGVIGTNNSAGDSSLRLGPNGGYSQVCRPDLYGYVTAHIPAGAAWTPANPATTYLLSSPLPGEVNFTLPNGEVRNVAYILGDIHINGQLNRPLTIVASGQVWIEGDISRIGGTNRYNAPALGIISDGNTIIQCGCGTDRHIDAMIFSDSTIDTCYTAPPGLPWTPGHCDNTLYLSGYIMAKDVYLHRLGPLNQSGAQPGEVITMDPTLYLNPPFGFSDVIDNFNLNGQGERAPLF